MPYVLHIPHTYQCRSHIIQRSFYTLATDISISEQSDLAQQIIKDVETWGWNWEHIPMDKWCKQQGTTWTEYTRRVKRKPRNYFDDIFRIWQREHGLRIEAREEALQRSSSSSYSLPSSSYTLQRPNTAKPRAIESKHRFTSLMATYRGKQFDTVLKYRDVIYTPVKDSEGMKQAPAELKPKERLIAMERKERGDFQMAKAVERAGTGRMEDDDDDDEVRVVSLSADMIEQLAEYKEGKLIDINDDIEAKDVAGEGNEKEQQTGRVDR